MYCNLNILHVHKICAHQPISVIPHIIINVNDGRKHSSESMRELCTAYIVTIYLLMQRPFTD